MILHHSQAILVCENASITVPEIKTLCDGISGSQQSEINQMKKILDERKCPSTDRSSPELSDAARRSSVGAIDVRNAGMLPASPLLCMK